MILPAALTRKPSFRPTLPMKIGMAAGAVVVLFLIIVTIMTFSDPSQAVVATELPLQ